MPKTTFYNLSAEKRLKIQNAIMNEILEAGISDASINQIVKNAGISRGSFYQYFEDKKDMMIPIMEELRNEMKKFMSKKFEAYPGDVLRVFYEGVLEISKIARTSGKITRFHQKLFMDRETVELFCSEDGKQEVLTWIVSEMKTFIDFDEMDQVEKENFTTLIEMLMYITGRIIIDLFSAAESEDKIQAVLNKYQRMLTLVRLGIQSEIDDIRHLDGLSPL